MAFWPLQFSAILWTGGSPREALAFGKFPEFCGFFGAKAVQEAGSSVFFVLRARVSRGNPGLGICILRKNKKSAPLTRRRGDPAPPLRSPRPHPGDPVRKIKTRFSIRNRFLLTVRQAKKTRFRAFFVCRLDEFRAGCFFPLRILALGFFFRAYGKEKIGAVGRFRYRDR